MVYLVQIWLWIFSVSALVGTPITIHNAWREHRDYPCARSYGALIGACIAPVVYLPSIYYCWLGVNSLA